MKGKLPVIHLLYEDLELGKDKISLSINKCFKNSFSSDMTKYHNGVTGVVLSKAK